jgi:hypothetical protein
MKLNVRAFAVALGIWWGLGLFILAWWVMWVVEPLASPTFVERIFIGYAFDPLGSLVGLVWGFVDGLIAGAIIAYVYNLVAEKLFSESEQPT